MAKVSPIDGGCWFCSQSDNRGMNFTREFDAYFHEECLEREFADKTSYNEEAVIIAREFDRKDLLENITFGEIV